MPHILIVDDDTSIQKMLKIFFENKKFKVSLASDGREAVYLQSREPADILLTDIFMPEQEGLETIREIRDKYPNTKIIAMSGGAFYRAPNDYLTIAQKIGAHDVICKPFELKEIFEKINRLSNHD
ncbi:MAG: Response regulator receiver protein [Candidatus Magnetoglobus multicellularis str. Araruama]|uniref:Response regulator receiver protein n=1 Tax=Candidatus Magnetoglobus multicellularis str. Araruama TaxID=890399 RepID=A0A1V1PFD4_9BACT|nr:MAG: Response regulator receiver protein [Candidatus Magnetoglobus multicellularis str. Araruama]